MFQNSKLISTDTPESWIVSQWQWNFQEGKKLITKGRNTSKILNTLRAWNRASSTRPSRNSTQTSFKNFHGNSLFSPVSILYHWPRCRVNYSRAFKAARQIILIFHSSTPHHVSSVDPPSVAVSAPRVLRNAFNIPAELGRDVPGG